MVYHTGKSVCAIPLTQYDPAIGSIREKVLVSVEREVLLIEISFQMQHVPHAHETGIVGSRKVAGIVCEYTGEGIPTEQWTFGVHTAFTSILHRRQGTPVFFQREGQGWCDQKYNHTDGQETK